MEVAVSRYSKKNRLTRTINICLVGLILAACTAIPAAVATSLAVPSVVVSPTSVPSVTPFPHSTVDASTMQHKLLMGYQGWFSCPGDGSQINGYFHWFRSDTPDAANFRVDMWPDTSELTSA